jgi:hypothetical protein
VKQVAHVVKVLKAAAAAVYAEYFHVGLFQRELRQVTTRKTCYTCYKYSQK